jgi:hypothetical protein
LAREFEPNPSVVYFFLEATVKYDFLKIHRPLAILNQWPETHALDLDTFVKKNMMTYGINNVRGGTYSETTLTDEQTAVIKAELNTGPSAKDISDVVIKSIIDAYADTLLSKADIRVEKDRLKADYAKWRKESRILSEIRIDAEAARADIEWIRQMCQKEVAAFCAGKRQTLLYRLENGSDIENYRRILPHLKKIYTTFMTIYDRPYEVVYAKNPEFLLDDFMFHWHRIQVPEEIEHVERLCEEYSFFVTYIENRMAEAAFDVSTWGEEAELRFSCSLFLLDLCFTC